MHLKSTVAIYSGNCGARGGNIFLPLRKRAAVVLSAFLFCIITDTSGQVNGQADVGFAGEGLAWIWHPDDATLFITPDGTGLAARDAGQYNYLMVHRDFIRRCFGEYDSELSRHIRANTKRLVINEGVKIIGYRAFQDMSHLEHVSFPGSLELIEDNAFLNTGLQKIVLPARNHTIRWHAFWACPLHYIVAMNETGYNGIYEDTALGPFFRDLLLEMDDGDLLWYTPLLYIPEGSSDKYKDLWPWYKMFHYWGEACPVVLATGVTLDKTSVTLTHPVKRTAQLTATVGPSNTTDEDVRWWSSDERVVHVSQTGHITALKTGRATITAVAHNHCKSDLSASCEVTVIAPGTDATLKNLKVNGVDISPFDPQTKEYAYTVSSSTTSVTITGETTDPFAAAPAKTAALATGDNILIFPVTAENEINGEEYRITVKRLSSDATLSDIRIGENSLEGFNPAITDYTLQVENSVVIAPTIFYIKKDNTDRTISSGPYTLSVGDNVFSCVVTSENEDVEHEYRITIRRLSNNAKLKTIWINGESLPEFVSTKTAYTFPVASGVSEVPTVEWKVADSAAAILSTEVPDTLITGDNVLSCKIISEDSVETLEYTVTVRRLNADTELSGITISDDNWAYSYTTEESVRVEYAKNPVRITATVAETATVSGNGKYRLNVGDNSIDFEVTAEDTAFKQDYRINVRRLSNNTLLDGYVVADSDVVSFVPSKYLYDIYVKCTVDNIRITAAPNDGNAVLTGAIGTQPLVKSRTDFLITVTAEDTTFRQDYGITVRRQPGLIAFRINGTAVRGFSPAITTYRNSVTYSTSQITIEALAVDTKATILQTGPDTLAVGDNLFTVAVISEDGIDTTTYCLTVRRLSNETALSGITVNETPVPDVRAGSTDCEITVNYGIKAANIAVEPVDSSATVLLEYPDTLTVGDNLCNITVISEDGDSVATYRLTIKRLPCVKPVLNMLSVSPGVLSPAFAADSLDYTVNVGSSEDSISIIASADTATVISGDTGKYLLPVGETTFLITATTVDTAVVYSIKAMRSAESGSGISPVAAPAVVRLRLAAQTLQVNSPVPEQVSVYSVMGTLLGSWNKQAGEASFTVGLTGLPARRIMIVKGSSGWCRKIVING